MPTGPAPTPYHVYDGDGLSIFGRVDPKAVSDVFAGEDVYPVTYKDGSVAAGFIFADFRSASMGPHRELQFFILSSFKAGEEIDSRPMSLPLAMALKPDWGTLCVKLWNDDRSVIAYNNDYLGLNASYADFDVSIGAGDHAITLNISDEGQAPILSADIRGLKSSAPSAMWEMLRIAGFKKMMSLGRQPYFRGSVINRKSDVLPANRQAPILTSSDRSVSRFWDAGSHSLTVHHDMIAQLGFEPRAVQHISPFRFIYLHPDDV